MIWTERNVKRKFIKICDDVFGDSMYWHLLFLAYALASGIIAIMVIVALGVISNELNYIPTGINDSVISILLYMWGNALQLLMIYALFGITYVAIRNSYEEDAL